jgi:hypothetical protein
MFAFLRSCSAVFRSHGWWLAILMVLTLSGCKTGETRDEGAFRRSDLSDGARQARSANAAPTKQDGLEDSLFSSDKAKQITRDLE